MSTSDRILAACAKESPIDVFKHAAAIVDVVQQARLKAFKRETK